MAWTAIDDGRKSGDGSPLRKLTNIGRKLCIQHDFLALHKIRGDPRCVRKFYDLWAHLYDLVYPRSDSYLASATTVVQDYVRRGDRVLDLGAGTGLLTLRMQATALSVVAFDLHEKMLVRARQKVHKVARKSSVPTAGTGFCQGNAMDLPFRAGSFDVVATAFMLMYLDRDQQVRALREARRVLVPGGRLVILTFQGEIHPRFTTKREWREILDTSGYGRYELHDFDEVFRSIGAVPAAP